MASFNKVILMGRLTANPEQKQTPSGVAVTSFTLAVDRKYNNGEEKQCDFITIVAWRQTAEFICKYFGKGQAILVCGELQTRTWKDKDGNNRYATEVVASEVNFCETKKEAEGNNTTPQGQSVSQGKSVPNTYIPQAYTQPSFDNVKDEDLPF
jgi:single-strand DNA-binding protein